MSDDKINIISSTEFGKLFSEYKSRFVTVAYGYLRDEMVAEDIVSDCFLSFWDKRNTLPADVNAPAYIMTSVKNRCLNWLNEQSRHAEIEQKLHQTRQRVTQVNIRSLELCDPQELFAGEVAEIVARQLAMMPELTRDVFKANRYMDKTYKEIAEEFDIPPRRVEYELQKAVRLLQIALKDYLPASVIALIINGLS